MGWQDAPEVKAAPAWASAPEVNSASAGGKIAQGLGNLAAGAIRGAGSIGATLLAPIDMASDAMAGKGLSLESNRQRRAGMDAGLQELGADPNSVAYKGGKLAGEVAGTLGAGGAVANVVGRAAPSLAAANPNLLTAIRTAGMEAGGATGLANPLVRAAGGAINGGVSVGLVNPDDAKTGAVLGAALPGAVQVVGKASNALGRAIKGPTQSPDVAAAVSAARESGYVVPPTQANPSLLNRTIEGFSGKITTAQNASAKNQAVTNAKAARAIGLAEDAKITPDVLDDVRKQAGAVYGELASLAPRPAVAADTLTNTKAVEAIDPAQMVFDLRKARNDATAWYRSYGRTADPDALVKAKTANAESARLEKTLEEYASSMGRDDLVPAMREARTLIAKTYSVENALNAATGTIDARKLASQLAKGKPLSGDLKEAAEFAARFPKASQAVEGMGSLPQTSPLDWALGGTLSAASANQLMLASVLARPVARRLALSPVVQNRLVQRPNALSALTIPDSVRRAGYQSALLAGSDQ